jgi:hypothetical protein
MCALFLCMPRIVQIVCVRFIFSDFLNLNRPQAIIREWKMKKKNPLRTSFPETVAFFIFLISQSYLFLNF